MTRSLQIWLENIDLWLILIFPANKFEDLNLSLDHVHVNTWRNWSSLDRCPWCVYILCTFFRNCHIQHYVEVNIKSFAYQPFFFSGLGTRRIFKGIRVGRRKEARSITRWARYDLAICDREKNLPRNDPKLTAVRFNGRGRAILLLVPIDRSSAYSL